MVEIPPVPPPIRIAVHNCIATAWTHDLVSKYVTPYVARLIRLQIPERLQERPLRHVYVNGKIDVAHVNLHALDRRRTECWVLAV